MSFGTFVRTGGLPAEKSTRDPVAWSIFRIAFLCRDIRSGIPLRPPVTSHVNFRFISIADLEPN
ncbi:hypothetical protein Pan189_37200 [Stratiformator vulcanicus]|uniref:Uncharacterized protein n=1 Tax=Stratiformator vulcanicus TaxID=2527980 RepID=A0A517R5Y5_9PLAN|nr:hypothetical protein Pan189_37200 [Stratiformator vulcanicus]